jgi:hypothetical protein
MSVNIFSFSDRANFWRDTWGRPTDVPYQIWALNSDSYLSSSGYKVNMDSNGKYPKELSDRANFWRCTWGSPMQGQLYAKYEPSTPTPSWDSDIPCLHGALRQVPYGVNALENWLTPFLWK